MLMKWSTALNFIFVLMVLTLFPSIGVAQEESAFSGADTAWILTSTALVLFMTLPGLALFYGGLVRAQNVLSVLMHCFVIACVASILWLVIGYSLAFDEGNAWIGGLGKVMLAGVGPDDLSGTIPEVVFFSFQMTFAIITPALIVGAYPERIHFGAVILFSGIWLLLVYAPVTHWVWGGGWLAAMGIMDFAGGIVVHLTAGVAAIVLALVLGSRRGFPMELRPPHNPGITMAGAAMLWVGWFGFNGGSALGANGGAGMAILVTHISAALGALTWMVIEWAKYGKPSSVGIVTGMVAGLASITPASGFVGPVGAIIIGIAGGAICQLVTTLFKQTLKIDDSLDVFAVHGVGGIIGTLLVAFLATPTFGGLGLAEGMTASSQFGVQVIGLVAVGVWTAILTFIIIKVVGLIVGLRVSEEVEIEGLDITVHGERGYEL